VPADPPPYSGSAEKLAAAYTAEADEHAARLPDEQRRPSVLWRVLSAWMVSVEAWLRSHGGTPLRLGIRIFWAVIALAGIVLLVGPVINPPLTLDDITNSASTATSRWIAREFDAHYTIARGADGRLSTTVTEKIDAFFPTDVDETGIQRVLATDYQGHALDPAHVTATLDGKAIHLDRSNSPTELTLSMDAGHRLSGDHSFVLRYQLHDLAYSTTDDATGKTVDLLDWDVFGPSWPQGFAGLKVSVTMPTDLSDRLLRRPRGEIAWSIIGAGQWLTPEKSVPGQVSYSFTVNQNIPPHANAGFVMNFTSGTFAMPPHDALWWIQTFGPIVPLLFLIISFLLALAARAVAWGDTHGRAWYVAQYDPPPDVSPAMAARILRSPAAHELAETLDAAQTGPSRSHRQLLLAVARAAQRAGRIGDRPRALISYFVAPERRGVIQAGLREVPHGFVRDTFIAGPIALTLVQWGLVRQLSYQFTFAIVWWPALFVLASTVLAIIVLAIALSARPLTQNGALVKQYLLGIREYVKQTNFLERATVTDKLLPYAVLVVPARQAGRRVVELVTTHLTAADATEGWRGPGYLTPPRLLIRILAPLAVIAAIVVVAAVPAPSSQAPDYTSYEGDLPGTSAWVVNSADLSATLSKTSDRRARIVAIEKLEVTFDKDSGDVPQFDQQFADEYQGQSLGLKVTGIAVDGTAVPFTVRRVQGAKLALTRMSNPLAGKHEVEVEYTVGSAAVAADSSHGVVDQVRWSGLLTGWDSSLGWGESEHPISPLSVSLTIPSSLRGYSAASGWIGARGAVPFGKAEATTVDDFGKAVESSTSGSGATTHSVELSEAGDGLFPTDFSDGDLGSQLDFPVGTFAGPDAGALRSAQFAAIAPALSSILAGVLALVIAAIGIVSGARRRPRIFAVGVPRDLVQILGPALALSSVILFGWASAHLYGNEPQFAPMIIAALASIPAVIVAIALTWHTRAPKMIG
jgi:hypothetical protein